MSPWLGAAPLKLKPMARHGIPTARYRICDSAQDAHALLARGELGFPVVVKADGLAAGKGVVVAPDREAADRAVHAAMPASCCTRATIHPQTRFFRRIRSSDDFGLELFQSGHLRS